MTATLVHVNNYGSTLNGAILIGATSLVVTSATGLPTLGSNYINLTLISGATVEIVKCTAISGTTLTIVRAQEGTSASAWGNGSAIMCNPTANSFDRKPDAPASSTASGIATYSDTTGLVLSNSGVVADSGAITTGAWQATPVVLQYGGTNANLTASNGGLVYSTASAMAILSGTATAGQLPLSGSSAAPTWSTSTYPSTNAANTLLYASSANTMAALATANNGVLITSGAGIPSISSTIPQATQLNITSVGTVTTGVWQGTPATVVYGGTGLATMTTAYAPVCAGTTATGNLQVASTGISTSGWVLTSTGASSLPTFQAAPGAGSASTPGTTTLNAIATWGGITGGSLLNNTGVTISSNILSTGTNNATINGVSVGMGNGGTTGMTVIGNGASGTANTLSSSVIIGYQAYKNNTTGADQAVVIGYQAGLTINNNGAGMVLIGYQAGTLLSISSQNNVFIGQSAGATATGASSCTWIGYNVASAMSASSSNNTSVFIGDIICKNATTSNSDNVYIGHGIQSSISGASCGQTVCIGSGAMQTGVTTQGTSAQHVNIGYAAAQNMTTSKQCVLVGWSAGTAITTALNTTGVGWSAFNLMTTAADSNTGLGMGVGITGATSAVALLTGSGNTWLGARTCGNSATCANSIAIGRDSLGIIATGIYGPGVSVGSAAFPVGVLSAGTIILSPQPGASGWFAPYINGTQYYSPLYPTGYTGYSSQVLTTGAVTLAFANGMYQQINISANATITLPTPVAGMVYTVQLNYTGAGGWTVAWAGGGTLRWPAGTAPTAAGTTAKSDIYTFKCIDTTNTFGFDGGRNY